VICWKIRIEESSKDETFGRKRVEILVDRFGSPDFKRELVEGTVVAIVVWMMWGVVWYGKWKGGFLFFFRRNFYEITRKKIRSVLIKAVGERMAGGR
jgi:hypothetical protein